jgi:hypothetical protein
MRIQSTDARERRWENLKEATGESTTSGALDVAAKEYLRLAGGTPAVPTGALEELLRAAEERGSLTGEEIAEILSTEELPLRYATNWGIGEPNP